MTIYEFDSKVTLGRYLPAFSGSDVRAEPMLFNCDAAFAYEHGGPITRAFLNALVDGEDGVPLVVDSRVHMLMPGWFPAIPGWHHDDVPRSRADGQPDYDALAYHSRHCMALVSGDVAPTEFIVGKQRLPRIEGGDGPVYKHWHDMTEQQVAARSVKVVQAPSNQMIFFDWQSMHRAVPAVKNGWRWFARASWQTERKPTNEIRSQVQVYLPAPTEGW